MADPTDSLTARSETAPRRFANLRSHWVALAIGLVLVGAQTWLVWTAMGGFVGLTNSWPILLTDFGLHFPHGLASRAFLRESGFTAGYDPSFMAGMPMSVISGTSSTWTNLAIFLFGGVRPAVAFKVVLFLSVAAAPLLIGWATALFGARPAGVVWSVGLYLIYFWTDFASQYVLYGMVSYFLAIPLGLVAVATLARYLEGGGPRSWGWATLTCSTLWLVHVTSPLVVAPAGMLAYGLASIRSYRGLERITWRRHAGFAALPVVILLVNAFWWLPGYWLRSTVGMTDFAFAHPESVFKRLGEIFTLEAPIEAGLLGLGSLGLVILAGVRPIAAAGLAGMILAGFGWGYLAGAVRALDGLQPGRQTYACYSGLCVAGGLALGEVLAWIKDARRGRLDLWIAASLLLLGARISGPSVVGNAKTWINQTEPILSSRPLAVMAGLIIKIREHLKPGDRLLFEESGISLADEPDPFFGHHFSPILPSATGVEVLGGPYLHTPVNTNFTQFGEGRLFGDPNWGRDHFVRYARLYRPVAIACWSRKAREFCLNNPDLIQKLNDDGVIYLGRVVGFEGATIRGQGRVEASFNRLVVRDTVPDTDGLVVLRYHATPCLVADTPTPIEPVYLEADPVPFIGLRLKPGQAGPITIRLVLPPPGGWFAAPRLLERPRPAVASGMVRLVPSAE